jgi:hypothetical protein
MNFNYRDFFIHNDDLHIIKEQLSIIDEMPRVADANALIPNAKDVWDKWTSLPDAQKDAEKIAEELEINVETVEKIIYICLMHTDEKKSADEIAKELVMNYVTIQSILRKALGSAWIRDNDLHIINNAEKIYNLHKLTKNPEEIKNSINSENSDKNNRFEEMTVDKVNLVLKIVNIATKQMENDGHINALEIERQIDKKISHTTVINLIKKLGIGKIQYRHKFTEEQDAFILFNYLQGIGPSEIARKFNTEFSTDSKNLNIEPTPILNRIRNGILNLKSDSESESEISEYALKLLTKIFPTVNIEKLDAETKKLLTHYTPAKTVGGRDRLARRGGNVDPTRQMSGKKGNLEPDIHQTITTGQIPASGQLGKKYGAPINTQGALAL